jgi:beta-phosphoglucomutase family hydrolase
MLIDELLDATRIHAVLFDLDGVLTSTATIHASCWKTMFDDFLRQQCQETGEQFRPFDDDAEYKQYVDGKPRYDGVRSFLESRGIELPYGSPQDESGKWTICGLGNRKDALVHEAIRRDEVEAYESSLELVRRLRAQGTKTAVVSSSANCEAVLEAVGIANLFDVRVDGKVGAELKLRGKPAPDTFLKAAELLGVEPRAAAVIEDAISGVQAGRDGGFALVIGVDREGRGDALRQHGADVVVADLGELIA